MGCLLAKSCKSMVEMLAKSCKSMVEMLEKSCRSLVNAGNKSHHLTISPSHHLTSHHLCNLREIVYYGVCTGFDEALARAVAVGNADGHAASIATH